MNAKACMAEDIIEVNRKKEYTLISSKLLESILTDSNLNAQTVKLWQLLFNKARYNPNLEIKISYSYLATALKLSTRTIARYISTLVKFGYLSLKQNYDSKGSQRPNTIAVRVPDIIIEQAKKKKDRVNRNNSDNNETLFNVSSHDVLHASQTETKIIPVDLDKNLSKSNQKTGVLRRTYNNTDATVINGLPKTKRSKNEKLNRTNNNQTNSTTSVAISQVSSPIQEATPTPNISRINHDNPDMGGDDINVIHIYNNKKDINKNNNNVVIDFSHQDTITTRIDSLIKKISNLELELAKGTKRIATIKTHDLLYDQMRKNTQITGELNITKYALEHLQKEIKTKQLENEILHKINNDPQFILTKSGDRALSSFTFKRLIKSLEGYGYEGNTLNSLVNEIIFEARFGNLTKCNKTMKALSLDNAINIGLKLVREKRWATPNDFKILTQ